MIERYAPPSALSEFVQGVFIGLSIAANILAIILLPARLKQRDKEEQCSTETFPECGWMYWAMARQPQ